MEWTQDISLGHWLAEATSGRLGGRVPDLLPRGFAGYARIFHPMSYSTPPDEEPSGPATWSQVAADFGTRMHPLAQSAALRRLADPWSQEATVSDNGRLYSGPEAGYLPQLPQVVHLLTPHTTTPDSCVAAIWEGWGGLVSSGGRMDVRLFASPWPRIGTLINNFHIALVNARSRFHRSPKPGTGILPTAIATGPQLELPGRNYFLARLGLDELATDGWEKTALWNDSLLVHSPSLLWPEDHAWALATEIDFDTTLVGGSRALIGSLVNSTEIEALEVPGDAAIYC